MTQAGWKSVGYTASLSSLAARNATFLLALIWMASPVAGLRPMRAARLRTWRMPRPTMRIRSPFLRCLVTLPTRSVRMASVCFFDSSWSSARPAARCLSVTVVGVAAFFAISGPPRLLTGFENEDVAGLKRFGGGLTTLFGLQTGRYLHRRPQKGRL